MEPEHPDYLGKPVKKKKSNSTKDLLKDGFIRGIGWAFGVTLGFVIVSTILLAFLNILGGLPLIGSWLASIVEVTQEQLLKRTLVIPK